MNIKGVVQRGPNTYRFTVSSGFDGNGKNVRHTMTYKVPESTPPTKAEKLVMAAYIEFANKCKNSQDLNEHMRFKELVEIYLKQYAPNKLKPVTTYNYRRDLEVHMLPVFANKKIKDISTQTLTKFFTGLDKAPETTRKLRTVMSSVFTFGVNQGYIKTNPCVGALCKENPLKNKKVKYLNKQQCQKLMELTSEYSTFNTIIQFLLFTGLRIGECLALRWHNVDFENNTVTIENTLCFADDKWFLAAPKTETSFRVLKLGTYTRELLLRHKREQDKLKAIVGDNWTHPDIVFTSVIGNFYDRSYVNKELKKILANNDMPIISVHGLRHSNASLMINNGINVKAVSEHLGHCNIAITADTYSHIFEEYKKKIAKCLEDDLIF